MTEITDDHMRQMMMTTRPYTVVLLRPVRTTTRPIATRSSGSTVAATSRYAPMACSTSCALSSTTARGAVWASSMPSPTTVSEIMDDDPGVRAGVFTYEVHPVRSFPGDTLAG